MSEKVLLKAFLISAIDFLVEINGRMDEESILVDTLFLSIPWNTMQTEDFASKMQSQNRSL